jgi:hypothetical protein
VSAPSAYELRESGRYADCGHYVQAEREPAKCHVAGCLVTFCTNGCNEDFCCEDCGKVTCLNHLTELTEGDYVCLLCGECKTKRDAEADEERSERAAA